MLTHSGIFRTANYPPVPLADKSSSSDVRSSNASSISLAATKVCHHTDREKLAHREALQLGLVCPRSDRQRPKLDEPYQNIQPLS